jgi:hypothetical protein
VKAIRQGVYTALTQNAGVAALVGQGVYHRLAPESAVFPYIVMQQQSGGELYSFGGRVARQTMWMVKAIAATHADAEAIDDACDLALTDAALNVAPYRLLICRRQQGIDYPERDGATVIHHVGALYQIEVT